MTFCDKKAKLKSKIDETSGKVDKKVICRISRALSVIISLLLSFGLRLSRREHLISFEIAKRFDAIEIILLFAASSWKQQSLQFFEGKFRSFVQKVFLET